MTGEMCEIYFKKKQKNHKLLIKTAWTFLFPVKDIKIHDMLY